MLDLITFFWCKEVPNLMLVCFKEMRCTFFFNVFEEHVETNLSDVRLNEKKYFVDKNLEHMCPLNPYANLFFKNLKNGIYPNAPICFSLDLFQSEVVVLDYCLKASKKDVEEKIENLAFNLLLKFLNAIVPYLVQRQELWKMD